MLDHEARVRGGNEERRDAYGAAGLAGGAGEDDVVRGVVDAGVPTLHAVDDPLVAVANGGGLEVGGVAAVVRFGQPEREPAAAVEESGHPLGDLLGCTEVTHHQHGGEVADDRRLVLQVVVEAETAVREVLADDRHLEVRCAAPAELLGEGESQPAGGIGAATHLAQQLLPLLSRHTVVVEVGARPLTAMVEEPHVVVGVLQREDLGLDERVEVVERLLDLGWDGEVHDDAPYVLVMPPCRLGDR